MTEEPTPTDPRALAVLEQILAVQTELLTLLRQSNEAGHALSNESLALQRQSAEIQRQSAEIQRKSAERQAIAIDTQRKTARLYRVVVSVAGILVFGGLAFVAFMFAHG